MTADIRLFSHPGEGETIDLGSGNRRRVILHTDELMVVEFSFEEGGIGALHSHPHVQASYIAEGVFEVTIDGNSEVLSAGGSFIVPSGLVHGVKALEAGRLIDSFTPHRADFL
ncbi:cupin domain-containing protein [Pararhizobium sp. BT-229]|uniref:cupin domain-containing protein n=1 Tax=Pararhizobium sp. BT-229 TaxID=2986923 RepID=UPI0021F69EAB|nr:cupin domain-containing protein [Pararhizobium sp. BT-229]MCV9967111.1 cupin domain-containing protein [Pararhizobium sp. BT-229]